MSLAACEIYGIMYKSLLLTYCCLHGLAPVYVTDLIQGYKPIRNIRSSLKQNLVSLSLYGHRYFRHASPEFWNKLPLRIKNSQALN